MRILTTEQRERKNAWMKTYNMSRKSSPEYAEKRKIYSATRRLTNVLAVRAANVKWYNKNKAKRSKVINIWREANPEKVAKYAIKNDAKQYWKNIGAKDITPQMIAIKAMHLQLIRAGKEKNWTT